MIEPSKIGGIATTKSAIFSTANASHLVFGSSLEEFFTYDPLNRLETERTKIFTPGSPGAYDITVRDQYDELGNIREKSGQDYTYDGACSAGERMAGPHAVCRVGTGPLFTYDDNGNMESYGGRSITYNDSNKNQEYYRPGSNGYFVYGAEGNRVVQSVTAGGTNARTVYVGLGATGKSLYERTHAGASSNTRSSSMPARVHDGNAFAVQMPRARMERRLPS